MKYIIQRTTKPNEIKENIICMYTIHDKYVVGADEAQFGGLVFQHTIGIPVGTNSAPLLVLFDSTRI